MSKKYFLLLILSVPIAFFSGRLFPQRNYMISGSGEGAIVLDTEFGLAWVLEMKQLQPTVNRDYTGPKLVEYLWIPTYYQSRTSFLGGSTPNKAAEEDEKTRRSRGF